MTAVAAHVVSVAKNHGATIDKVTYDSVALHWNVNAQAAGRPRPRRGPGFPGVHRWGPLLLRLRLWAIFLVVIG